MYTGALGMAGQVVAELVFPDVAHEVRRDTMRAGDYKCRGILAATRILTRTSSLSTAAHKRLFGFQWGVTVARRSQLGFPA